ncbi:hypothetical protein Tco_1548117 [Tanacetum coccineum]
MALRAYQLASMVSKALPELLFSFADLLDSFIELLLSLSELMFSSFDLLNGVVEQLFSDSVICFRVTRILHFIARPSLTKQASNVAPSVTKEASIVALSVTKHAYNVVPLGFAAALVVLVIGAKQTTRICEELPPLLFSLSARLFRVSGDMLFIPSLFIKKLNLSRGKALVKMSAS